MDSFDKICSDCLATAMALVTLTALVTLLVTLTALLVTLTATTKHCGLSTRKHVLQECKIFTP